jgi:hypothetical protein
MRSRLIANSGAVMLLLAAGCKADFSAAEPLEKMLYSGVRSAQAILGDSLAGGSYGVRAIVNTEGTKKALIYAGRCP